MGAVGGWRHAATRGRLGFAREVAGRAKRLEGMPSQQACSRPPGLH